MKKSKEAKNKYGQAKDNEQAQMNGVADWVDEQIGGNGGSKVDPSLKKISVGEKATANGTINGKSGNYNNPTIPEGYTPINDGLAVWGNGSSAPTQEAIEHGLVIKDDSNNEWVWVPVDSATLAKMCDMSNTEEHTLCGTSGDTAVKTTKYSKSYSENMERVPSGEIMGFHEPDLIVGVDEPSFDASAEYYNTILGFASKEKMAESIAAAYNEMITSIQKYGGFYIGRYELSEDGVQKDKAPLSAIAWYTAYKECKDLNASDKVETGMIWGIQWDVTCDFIANKGDKKSITDSRSWGNYADSIAPANTGNYEKNSDGFGQQKNTGSNEAWKANNIYDLAGNCEEWTQEGARSYPKS